MANINIKFDNNMMLMTTNYELFFPMSYIVYK